MICKLPTWGTKLSVHNKMLYCLNAVSWKHNHICIRTFLRSTSSYLLKTEWCELWMILIPWKVSHKIKHAYFHKSIRQDVNQFVLTGQYISSQRCKQHARKHRYSAFLKDCFYFPVKWKQCSWMRQKNIHSTLPHHTMQARNATFSLVNIFQAAQKSHTGGQQFN